MNSVTIDGLAALIKSKRLFVLDAGAVYKFQNPRSSFSSFRGDSEAYEKLIPLLEKNCSSNLTSLRLHHDVVVKTASRECDSVPVAFELSSRSARVEIDGRAQVFELGVGEDEPRYELYGDSTHLVVSPAVGEPPALTAVEKKPVPNSGPAFAPEVMEPTEVDDAPILTATGLIYPAQAVNGINVPQTLAASEGGNEESVARTGTPELTIALIERQRHEFRQALLAKLVTGNASQTSDTNAN